MTFRRREAWGPLPIDDVKQDEHKKQHYEENLIYPVQDLGSHYRPPDEGPEDAELDEGKKDETETNTSISEEKIVTSLPLRSTPIKKLKDKDDTQASGRN